MQINKNHTNKEHDLVMYPCSNLATLLYRALITRLVNKSHYYFSVSARTHHRGLVTLSCTSKVHYKDTFSNTRPNYRQSILSCRKMRELILGGRQFQTFSPSYMTEYFYVISYKDAWLPPNMRCQYSSIKVNQVRYQLRLRLNWSVLIFVRVAEGGVVCLWDKVFW